MSYQPLNNSQTYREFKDVTDRLSDPTLELLKNDVVRGITPERKVEQTVTYGNGQRYIYYFFDKKKSLSGRIFPCDELIIPGENIDIVVSNIRLPINNMRFNIDANPYHDLRPEESFRIRVSQIGKRGDPEFTLYNRITGFVMGKLRGSQITVGTSMLVSVTELRKSGNKEIVLVKPLEIIAEE